jgi:hypothetical protein
MGTTPITIVGLMGAKGCGKSVGVADHLIAKHGFVRAKFADPLKSMLRCLGLTDAELEGDMKEMPCAKLGGQTPRHAMVTLGTEWGRKMIDPDLWVYALESRLMAVEQMGGHGVRIVVDDVRFISEANMLRRHGAHIWLVERPGREVPAGAHQSEREHLSIEADISIQNDGDLKSLADAVDYAVELFI